MFKILNTGPQNDADQELPDVPGTVLGYIAQHPLQCDMVLTLLADQMRAEGLFSASGPGCQNLS